MDAVIVFKVCDILIFKIEVRIIVTVELSAHTLLNKYYNCTVTIFISITVL